MPRAALSRIAAVIISLIALVAVASTARTFSATVDEPAHIAAGLQWLTSGEYTYDLQHPPLGRIALAAGPYARGERGEMMPGVYDEGSRILGVGPHYVETLASARRGVLPFLALMLVAVWLWGWRIGGDKLAAAAVLFTATNPNVLAHAGLATTDVACAATTVLALLAAVWWMEAPSYRRAVLLGIAVALAVGTRLSALAFLGVPLLAIYLKRVWAERRWSFDDSRSRGWAQVAIAFVIALLGVLLIYRFNVHAFVEGIRDFLTHGSSGHPTFLLGTPSNRGWWYYFPVALLVKTPIPLLLLSLVGGAAVTRALRERREWQGAAPLVAALTIVLISLFVKVDLGVRLVLPVYPLLAIVAARGAKELWNATNANVGRMLAAALIAWAIAIPIRAHPDHLAYFNALAGDHPENILVDSNLDWGQDLYRLRDTLAARGVRDTVRVAYFGTSKLSAVIPNARGLGLHEHTTGWIAASETFLAGEWVGKAYMWLLDYPAVARVGPGMVLWYIPPDKTTRDSLPR